MMAEVVVDILKKEGWAAPEGWRAYHYMVATGEDASTDPARPVPLARSLCSTKVPGIQMIVPDDGFWPAPPRSSGAHHDDMGACDICKLAARQREWHKKDATLAIVDSLRAVREALGKEAAQHVTFNFSGELTPEVVADALGALQRAVARQHARLQRVERALAGFQLARAGFQFLMATDGSQGLLTAFAPAVVDAQIKAMKGAAIE
jgi:hypothetical protein